MDFSREQLQMIIQCAPGYAVMYLTDGASASLTPFLYTKNAPSFSGLTEEEYLELYRNDASKVILKQDMEMVQDTIRKIFDGGIQGVCTYRTYHRTRGYVWTQAELKWIGEYEGRHVLFGTFRDISRQIAEDTPGGFFIYAAQEDDQFFFVSENMLRMLGYDREEFQEEFRNHFRCMVYEKDRDATLKSIDDQIAANGQYDTVEYRIRKKDGSLLWVHDEGHYVVDQDGRAWFYVTINDISGNVAERQMLQQENSRLGDIINSIPAGISVYRISGGKLTLMAATQMTCDLFGVNETEMKLQKQESFTEHVHPDDAHALTDTMRSVVNPGRHMSPPFRYDNGKGGWRWLRIIASSVQGKEEERMIYAVITDLTAEMKAETAIAESRRKQRENFQGSVKSLLFANPQSLCTVRLNLTRNRCVEWYGTSRYVINTIRSETAEGVIRNISGIILNEQHKKNFLEHFQLPALIRLFQSGKSSDVVRYRRSVEDGTSIWVETVVNMVEDPETHDIEAVLYSENVNEQELNREIIQKLTDTGYDYIAILRISDQIFFFRYLGDIKSSVYLKRLGNMKKPQQYRDTIEYAVSSWVDPQEKERFIEETRIEEMVRHLDEENNYTFNVKARRGDGSEGWKQIRTVWLDETKEWILVQQTDVTDTLQHRQKELMERLDTEKALRYEADQANESKSNFLANVSHDMRTPLNAILGYDRLAQETDSKEQKDDYLNKIGQAGSTLLSLINDTLDLQKIETGTTTLHTAPVSCKAIVDGILTAVKPMMDAKGIHFRFDNSKAVMAVINIDSMHVQEIFINLLSNATKFTPRGGNVLFAVECEKETPDTVYDKLTVKDDGCGISEDFLPKIFDPFTQERNQNNANIGGSGLGLSIVKRLVDLMGGSIEVESRIGVGTTFTVRLKLPKAKEMPSPENTVPSALKPTEIAGKKILLCEDNEMNREIAKAILAKKGIEADCAADGREGTEMFEKSKGGEYAAILMDIRMPVMDGYEATKAIRASSHPDSRTVPILAMTADAYSGDISRAQEAGMDAHLSKPIDVDKLMSELERLIHR
jgi:PAS domain S-box-containing protein